MPTSKAAAPKGAFTGAHKRHHGFFERASIVASDVITPDDLPENIPANGALGGNQVRFAVGPARQHRTADPAERPAPTATPTATTTAATTTAAAQRAQGAARRSSERGDPPADYLVVLCTCADEGVAVQLGRKLIEAKAAACVNVLPAIRSIYRWQDAVCDDSEVLMLIKTTRPGYAAVEQLLQIHHPYDVPEILALPVAAGFEPYLAWLETAIG